MSPFMFSSTVDLVCHPLAYLSFWLFVAIEGMLVSAEAFPIELDEVVLCGSVVRAARQLSTEIMSFVAATLPSLATLSLAQLKETKLVIENWFIKVDMTIVRITGT